MSRAARPARVLIVAMGVLIAASPCALGQASMRPETELERIEFWLADVRYHILVPRRSRLAQTNTPGCAKIWHPLSTRSMIFLELCSAPAGTMGPYARQATLSNGARVRYSVDHDIGGGSGGTEGELKGEIDLDGRVLALTCRDQGEWRNNPDWCVHYLGHLGVQR